MTPAVQIFLDNYPGVYYPGQTIVGRVDWFTTSEENFRALKIRFDGRAETSWTETERYYDDFFKEDRERTVEYSDDEVYFNAEYILVHGGDNSQFPLGVHSYPFSFVLPQQLPSSFEGEYGQIRYNIRTIIDRPWRSDDETLMPLNIVSPLDLNYVPHIKEPFATSVDTTPCSCWCQNSGPITFNWSLPVRGFAPGQEVNIGAHIENMSNVSVTSVEFQIVAKYEYIVNQPESHNYEEKFIAAVTEGGVGAHGDKSWTSTLVIPKEQQFPNLNACSLITVRHTLETELILPCPHSNLRDWIKLEIGAIPLIGVDIGLPGPPPLPGDSYLYNPTAPAAEDTVNASNPSNSFGDTSSSTAGIVLTPHSPEKGLPSAGALNPSGVPPYPSEPTAGWSVPTKPPKDKSSSAPPTYDEAQQLKEKFDSWD